MTAAYFFHNVHLLLNYITWLPSQTLSPIRLSIFTLIIATSLVMSSRCILKKITSFSHLCQRYVSMFLNLLLYSH